MKMTGRDRLVLVRSSIILLWFGLLLWTLHYSFWLALAFTVYSTFHRTLVLKYLNR
jgi:hypothetical protein